MSNSTNANTVSKRIKQSVFKSTTKTTKNTTTNTTDMPMSSVSSSSSDNGGFVLSASLTNSKQPSLNLNHNHNSLKSSVKRLFSPSSSSNKNLGNNVNLVFFVHLKYILFVKT